MLTPIVSEMARRLEPVSRDTFLDGLPHAAADGGAEPSRGAASPRGSRGEHDMGARP